MKLIVRILIPAVLLAGASPICPFVPCADAAPNPGEAGFTHLDALSNIPPTASAGSQPIIGEPGVGIAFDASSSSDRDGTIVRAVWDFGDGTSAAGIAATHVYDRPGAWLALLTVSDDQGAFASTPVMVHVGSQPTIVTEDVTITSSMGDRIHARIHRPDDDQDHPVVIRYSIYCVSFDEGDQALVRSGYVFISGEAPGVCGSGGKFDLWGPRTAVAGHDLVEWAAGKEWSSGDVALVGHSGPAITAMATALEKPPHLRTVVLGSPIVDFYRDVAYPGGTLTWGAAGFNALLVVEPRPGMEAERVEGWLDWETELLTHDADDAFWQARSLAARFADLEVPGLFVTSWNDIYWRGALELFENRVRSESRVVLYPGPHYNMGDPQGTMGYRSTAEQNVHAGSEERVWLDRWLRNIGEHDARPPLAYYLQSGGGGAAQSFSTGEWRFTDEWPHPDTAWERRYLAAPSRIAPGLLSADIPSADAAGALLTPSHAGLGNPSWIDFLATSHRQADGRPMWDLDQRIDEPGSLTFETEAFADAVEVTGPLTLEFTAAVLSTDATFHAVVSDVWPDGSAHWLTQGTLRASMRAIDEERTLRNDAGEIVRVFHPHDRHDEIVPAEDAAYVVEIWPTANRFESGHRLRLQLSVSQPWYADAVSAGAILRLDAARPASILLPVRR